MRLLCALFLAVALPAFADQAVQLGGPGVCELRPKGADARAVYAWFHLQYPIGYSALLCWWSNAPYMRGVLYNRQQRGVCPVSGVQLNGHWVFSRQCNAADLFQ